MSIPRKSGGESFKRQLNAIASRGKSQVAKFKDAARALECNESEVAFDESLTKIGRANVPKNDVTPKQRRAKKKPLKLAI